MPSPERAMRDVTARGIRMRVHEVGGGDQRPVLLIHSLLGYHGDFDRIIGPLGERFRVLAPDLPGHGASEKPNPTRYAYAVENFATSMADLVAAYGIGQANIVGHGLGASIALTMATMHPELVDRLVVIGPYCYPTTLPPSLRGAALPIVGGVVFKQLFGRGSFRNYYRDEVYSSNFKDFIEHADEAYRCFNSPAGRESAYATWQGARDTRTVVARVNRVQHPTLVLWGRRDKIQPVRYASRLARQLSRGWVHLFDTGHMPQMERPRAVLDVITEFLEGQR